MAFLAAVPSFVISLQGIDDPSTIDLDVSVVELVASLLAALGPAAMATYLLWRDGRLRSAGFERRPAAFIAGYGALGWVCTLIAIVTVAMVVNAVILATGGELEDTTETSFDLTIGTALAAIALAVVAGIGEEIVFRAYAISRMEEAGYGRAAAIVPWLVFTSVHLYQGPLALLFIGAVGGVFTWLYLWRRSVYPCIVAHFLYDATVLLIAAAS